MRRGNGQSFLSVESSSDPLTTFHKLKAEKLLAFLSLIMFAPLVFERADCRRVGAAA
jgi:hypothetical protein